MPSLAIVLAFWMQASTLLQQGRTEYLNGHFAAAERLLVDALGQLAQGDNGLRAKALGNLGDVYSEQEEYMKAESAYFQALSLWRQLSDPGDAALMLHNLGMIYSIQERNDEALRFLTQAYRFVQSASPGDPSITAITAQVLNGLGIVHYRRNSNNKAEQFFNQALDIVQTSGVEFNTAGVLNNLGALYLREHKFKQAEDVLNHALKIKEANQGLADPDLIPELNTLGAIFMATGKYLEAEQQYERSLMILQSRRTDFAPAIARALHSLSRTYSKLGRQLESDNALMEAANIARENLNKDSEMARILEDYSRLLKSHGKTEEAAVLRAQLKRARAVADLVVRPHPSL
jgi:tetratricopeptide (TPR) repeat protein